MVLMCHCFFNVQSETLADHIKFDHGYTAKSPAIVNVYPLLDLERHAFDKNILA